MWLKFLGLACAITAVAANELIISSKPEKEGSDRQQCNGIYSNTDWSGPKESYIDVAFDKTGLPDDPSKWISLVIYEYRDVDLIGVELPNEENNKKYVCDDVAIAANMCEKDQEGQYIIESSDSKYAPIVTEKITLENLTAIRYPVKKTGYYCVSTYPNSDISYKAVINFQNAYGNLAASEIAKLSFFAGAAIAYAVVLGFWMFSYVQFRHDVLPVQNSITCICVVLVIEMIVIWGYYDLVNSKGSGVGVTVYMVFMALLNSIRNAFTFFLLLIVCLGYGVVVPTLGPTMIKCRLLAIVHFIFTFLYTIISYKVLPDDAGAVAFVVVLPLTCTMTIFYTWILSSLTTTMITLEKRKQHVKARMYKILWYLLLSSIIVIFGFFVINVIIIAHQSTKEYITEHWKSRWFILDGWINVVYFVDFCVIAYVWRPTENNSRFAMSSQLAQDEDEVGEFEIGSLRESLDEEQNAGAHELQNLDANLRSVSEQLAQSVPRDENNTTAGVRPTGKSDKHSEQLRDDESTIFELHEDEDEEEGEGEGTSSNWRSGTLAHGKDEDEDKWSDDETKRLRPE